jgi:hypothetical protein
VNTHSALRRDPRRTERVTAAVTEHAFLSDTPSRPTPLHKQILFWNRLYGVLHLSARTLRPTRCAAEAGPHGARPPGFFRQHFNGQTKHTRFSAATGRPMENWSAAAPRVPVPLTTLRRQPYTTGLMGAMGIHDVTAISLFANDTARTYCATATSSKNC